MARIYYGRRRYSPNEVPPLPLSPADIFMRLVRSRRCQLLPSIKHRQYFIAFDKQWQTLQAHTGYAPLTLTHFNNGKGIHGNNASFQV
jgi:hypothetical protein